MKKVATLQMGALVLSGLLTLGLLGAGCKSREAKIARFEERAAKYFETGEYPKAELEYINLLRLANRELPHVIRNLGIIYQAQGKIAKAYAFLNKARTLAPEDLATRTKLALVYLANREFTNALNEVEFVLQRAPTHAEALEILPDTAYDTNSAALVEQRLESVRPQAGNSAAFHVALGKLHHKLRDYARAEADFQRALELNPKFSSAYWGLGGVSLAQTNEAKAEQAFATAAEMAPPRSFQRLNLAEYKILSGDAAGGKRILTEIVEQVPDFLPALIRLANLALSETNYTECSNLVNRVMTQDSINLEGLMLNARLNLAQKQPAKCIETLDKLLETYPGAYLAYYHRSVAFLANQEVDKAIRDLKQVVAIVPNYANAVFLLAELQMRTQDAPSAITGLTEFLREKPNAAQAQFLLAQAHQMMGRLDEALAICRGLMQRGLKEPRVPLLTGTLLRQQGKLAEARKVFEQFLAEHPGNLAAINQLAGLDVAAKNYAAAVERLQASIEKEPKSAELQWMLANVYEAQTNLTGLESALLKTIELNPDVAAAYTKLAGLYLKAGQAPKAVAQLEARLARNAQDLDALAMKALIHEQRQEFDQAREDYERILAVNPRLSSVQNNLAYLLVERLGDLDQAYAVAQDARKNNPNDPALADTLGWILVKRGDYAAALPLLQESAQKLPDEAEVQYHLGVAWYMTGKEKAAQTALQQAVQSGKEYAGKSDAQQRLALLSLPTAPTAATAIATLEQALKTQPADPIAALRLGAIHEQAGAWDKARAVYESVLQANPRVVPVILNLARLYAQPLNDAPKALELAKDARKLAPEDPGVAYTLGQLAFTANDHQWALSLLLESAPRLTGQAEPLYHLAWSYYSVGKVTEALANMQRALQLEAAFPGADAARQFIAMVPLGADAAKAVAAQAKVQAALQANPADVPALLAASLIYEQQGDLAAAKQACDQALGRFPHFTPANRQLARLYLRSPADYDQVYGHATKAREAFPQDAEIAKALGIATYQRKDFSRALQLFKESAVQRGFDAELLYYLGMAHYQLKQNAECKAALQKAVALQADAPWAAEANQILAGLK